MKRIVRYILLAAVSMAALSCEDFDLGDSFLQKPPSVDITIDTVFSNAEYARRVLWNSYDKLPFGLPITGRKTVMNWTDRHWKKPRNGTPKSWKNWTHTCMTRTSWSRSDD